MIKEKEMDLRTKILLQIKKLEECRESYVGCVNRATFAYGWGKHDAYKKCLHDLKNIVKEELK